MIVVGDTSVLRALQALDLIRALGSLYADVAVPPAVAAELSVAAHPLGAFPLREHGYIRVVEPRDRARVRALSEALGEGESEAIALCIELAADLLLIDERGGRSEARRLGVRTRGALGLLVDFKRRRLCGAVGPLVDRLQSAIGFRVSAAVREAILREAGEWPETRS